MGGGGGLNAPRLRNWISRMSVYDVCWVRELRRAPLRRYWISVHGQAVERVLVPLSLNPKPPTLKCHYRAEVGGRRMFECLGWGASRHAAIYD